MKALFAHTTHRTGAQPRVLKYSIPAELATVIARTLKI